MVKQLPEGNSNPEIMLPDSQVSIGRWRVNPTLAVVIKVGLALPALGVAGWLLQNFLQLRGVVNVIASQVDLAFLALSLIVAGWALTIGLRRKRRWRIVLGLVICFSAL